MPEYVMQAALPADLSEFERAYIEALYFTDNDDDGSQGDGFKSADDLAPETLARAREDCRQFWDAHGSAIEALEGGPPHGWAQQAGHDFWLTRNGHGAGFWDGDWPDDLGEKLTEAAHAFGQVDTYAGDDGLIYFG